MTLIIKELIIRGEVIEPGRAGAKAEFTDADLLRLVEQVKKEVKEDFLDKIQELETRKSAR
ncbi:DUF5908 family protein [Algoriphagus namhaensis]